MNAVRQRSHLMFTRQREPFTRGNPITLKGLFEQDGALAEVGGAAYLVRLANSVVTIINAEDYGRLIYDLHLRRQAWNIAECIVAKHRQGPIATVKLHFDAGLTKFFNLAPSE